MCHQSFRIKLHWPTSSYPPPCLCLFFIKIFILIFREISCNNDRCATNDSLQSCSRPLPPSLPHPCIFVLFISCITRPQQDSRTYLGARWPRRVSQGGLMLEKLKEQVAAEGGRGGVEGFWRVANSLRRVLMSGKFPRRKNTRPNPHAASTAAPPMQISHNFAACTHKYSRANTQIQ